INVSLHYQDEKRGCLGKQPLHLAYGREIKTLDQVVYLDYCPFLKTDKEENFFSFLSLACQIFSYPPVSTRTCIIQYSDFYTLHSKYHPVLPQQMVEVLPLHHTDHLQVVLSPRYLIP